MGDFIHFSDLIPKAIAKYSLQRESRAAQVCQRFRELTPELIGEGSQEQVKPKFFRAGILYVDVLNSLWAQKVIVKRHELLEALNHSGAKPAVKDIRTKVGEL